MLRLLAVHAHPDDESSKGAGTYAYYRSLGVDVLVVTCTGGEAGDVQNPSLDPVTLARAERDMAGLRRTEMAAAQAAMGIRHRWLGYEDSGLPEQGEAVHPNSFARIPLEHSGAPMVRIVREFRPHVLVTYDESGGYPHPDHIRAHELALWTVDAAADAALLPALGAPWQVSKLYYDRIFNGPRATAVRDALDADHPMRTTLDEIVGWMGDRPDASTTRVPVGDFLEIRDAALRAHASQVPADSAFFFWPNDVQRVAWPWEDFQLVRSLVETELPETDLFAGIAKETA